jgi:NADPH-dependent 2,4-dienoyl-CoA reductase/sulfur reductase-like enzyme
MRVADGTTEAVGAEIEFSFNGRALKGRTGETIAAAAIAAGEHGFRIAKDGSRRGVFCGMGVCQECLVVVDGVASQRACMTAVTPARSWSRSPTRRRCACGPSRASAEAPRAVESCDLLIVGGGAGGLAAARAALDAGVTPVVIDERPKLGGQYYKQLASSQRYARADGEDAQARDGRQLIESVEAGGATILRGAQVWGGFSRDEIAVEHDGATRVFAADTLILAPGAYERGVPFPGWTLPGVMTTGAAQTLLRAYRVAPGRRVLLAGNGPLNLQVAAELVAAGVEVVAIAEAARAPFTASPAVIGTMLRHAPDLVIDGLKHLARVKRAGVVLLHRHAIVRATGEGRVSEAVLAAIDESGRAVAGSEKRFAVDAVCLGYGFHPQSELARALGVDFAWDAARATLVARRGEDGATNVDGVWLVGDGGGLGGARVARAQGTLAGAAAAQALGRTVDGASVASARAALASARAFQAALWEMYRAPLLAEQLATPDTLICRCEEVRCGDVATHEAAAGGEIGALKRDTRLGMGRCQGRYCAPLAALHMNAGGGDPLFAPRAPAKPIALAAIARREHE